MHVLIVVTLLVQPLRHGPAYACPETPAHCLCPDRFKAGVLYYHASLCMLCIKVAGSSVSGPRSMHTVTNSCPHTLLNRSNNGTSTPSTSLTVSTSLLCTLDPATQQHILSHSLISISLLPATGHSSPIHHSGLLSSCVSGATRSNQDALHQFVYETLPCIMIRLLSCFCIVSYVPPAATGAHPCGGVQR